MSFSPDTRNRNRNLSEIIVGTPTERKALGRWVRRFNPWLSQHEKEVLGSLLRKFDPRIAPEKVAAWDTLQDLRRSVRPRAMEYLDSTDNEHVYERKISGLRSDERGTYQYDISSDSLVISIFREGQEKPVFEAGIMGGSVAIINRYDPKKPRRTGLPLGRLSPTLESDVARITRAVRS